MMKDEVIKGLKAGHALMMDGWATAAERDMIDELEDAGLIDVELRTGDQYSAYRITWKKE